MRETTMRFFKSEMFREAARSPIPSYAAAEFGPRFDRRQRRPCCSAFVVEFPDERVIATMGTLRDVRLPADDVDFAA